VARGSSRAQTVTVNHIARDTHAVGIEEDHRPDMRSVSPATSRLRAATRALRLHLDELPVDYSEAVPPDRFVTGLAFMFARNRYACAESMIGSGFGGTVIGAVDNARILVGSDARKVNGVRAA
jgi:hypothetical protein